MLWRAERSTDQSDGVLRPQHSEHGLKMFLEVTWTHRVSASTHLVSVYFRCGILSRHLLLPIMPKSYVATFQDTFLSDLNTSCE